MAPFRGTRSAPVNPPSQSARPTGDPRARIGIIALLLLGAAGYLAWQDYINPPAVTEPAQWMGASVRVGLLLATVWLAWPDLRKLSPWMLGLVSVLLPITIIVIARWPRYLPGFLVLGVVIYLLRPRGNRRLP